MSNDNNAGADGDYWGRDGLGQSILDALAAAGKDLTVHAVEQGKQAAIVMDRWLRNS